MIFLVERWTDLVYCVPHFTQFKSKRDAKRAAKRWRKLHGKSYKFAIVKL